jgi:hypothetical protein
MNKTLKTIFKYLILFIIGAASYYGLECLWRGWSDWTMAITSGTCYLIIGGINEYFTCNYCIFIDKKLIEAKKQTYQEILVGL